MRGGLNVDKLSLVRSESFGAVVCDFWESKDGVILMTAEQLGAVLGYADPAKGISNLVSRNGYLDHPEFSSTLKMRGESGKLRETRVFTEDGIYEVSMLAGTDKAMEFRAKIRGVLKDIRAGRATLVATKQIRRELTDILEDSGENDRMYGHAHKNYTDLIYKHVTGKLAFQLREDMGLPKTANVREHLPLEMRVQIARLEDAVRSFVAMGYSYGEIKGFLEGKALMAGGAH
jgi:hypothetical protein